MRVLKKTQVIRAVVVILLALFVTISFIHFRRSSLKIVERTATESLKETAEFYARTFEMKINDQLSMLESQTRYFQKVDMNDYRAVKNTIISTKGIGEFKRIAVANRSGMTINYQGNTSGNIFLTEYFVNTIQTGKPRISKNINIDEDDEDVLVLSVPIIQNGNTNGVITGTFSYSILDNLFSVTSFDGFGYSDVVSNDGQIIVSSSNNDKSGTLNMFESAIENGELTQEQLKTISYNMQNNKSDMFTIISDNKKYYCYYTPVGVNDWYVFSYVDYQYLISTQNDFVRLAWFLVAVLCFCFFALILIIYQMQKENNQVQQDVEKYEIASEQNRACIFEYDLKAKKIKFTGNYEYVFGKIKNPIDLLDLRKTYSRIHEDDRNVMSHMNEFFLAGEENFTAEVRFKCVDDEYRWFRLSGTAIKNANEETACKFVGNFTNVDAQMNHEQELRRIAETDLLSGLLNKSFFKKNVTRLLNTVPEDTKGAFFIIDLDNFKKINDTLGHAMGDIAIRDTAQKINLIFSQKDIMGRIGGDEFCVFMRLEHVTENLAAKIIMEKAATLNENLQEYYNNDVASVKISASIGIALFPQHGTEYSDLFQNADAALYHVKKNGKNGNAIYNASMKNGEKSYYE